MPIPDPTFYEDETDEVARRLLGMLLVRRYPDGALAAGRIVEVEAYFDGRDGASHARSGQTARNAAMFGPSGRAYVYFTYGMHWMLNVVAHRNHPAGAVLLRAIEPCRGIEQMRQRRAERPDRELTNGPAKICQALAVDGSLDGIDLCDPAGPLTLMADEELAEFSIASGPRVGIGYCEEPWRSRPLRFCIQDNSYVSRGRPAPPANKHGENDGIS